MSVAGLDAVPGALTPFIARGELSGVVALTWHQGEIVQALALGCRDIATASPVRRDTLFRIASMTKPIVSAAAMMLVDEGRLALDDPITRWMPELADMQVLRRADGALTDVVPADRDITVEDLLTHKAGIAYAMFSEGAIAEACRDLLGDGFGTDKTPDEWLAALGTLPLSYQPGERMHYGHATDVLGFLIARIDGEPLADVLERRIFAPLGMRDTAFGVRPEKEDRLATMYRHEEGTGEPIAVDLPGFDTPGAFASGGVGLISTADDYLAFARLLLGDGEVDGVRLLRPETVRDMRTDRLTSEQRRIPFIGAPTWAGMGFGLGLGLVDVPEKNLLGCGRTGSFTWPGAFGTWWQADPAEQIVMVYMVQHLMPLNPDIGATIASGRGMAGREALPVYQRLTYDALTGPA